MSKSSNTVDSRILTKPKNELQQKITRYFIQIARFLFEIFILKKTVINPHSQNEPDFASVTGNTEMRRLSEENFL